MNVTLEKDIVKAGLIADAICLAVHWIYDSEKVKEIFLQNPKILPLSKDTYHKHAKKGDFTHYGEQALLLLNSVIANKGFNELDWAEKWQIFFIENINNVYFDGASKTTLDNIKKAGKPYIDASSSNDLSPMARSAALFLNFNVIFTEDEVVTNVVKQASLTTNVKAVLDLCEYFSRLIFRLKKEKDLPKLLKQLKSDLKDKTLINLYDAAENSTSEDTIKVLNDFQLSCSYLHLFPNIIHILKKYHNKPYEAIINSIIAGGDNATRTSIVAMVLTAYHGNCSFLPSDWYQEINKKLEIDKLLSEI